MFVMAASGDSLCFLLDDLIGDIPCNIIKELSKRLSVSGDAKDLAVQLNIPNRSIDLIDFRGENPAAKVIDKWKQLHPDSCTVRVLLAKLEEMDRLDLANLVRDQLKNPFRLCVVLVVNEKRLEERCQVEGKRTLGEVVKKLLKKHELELDDVTIEQPKCPISCGDTQLAVNWNICAHHLRASQVTLGVKIGSSKYESINNLDLRSDLSMSFNVDSFHYPSADENMTDPKSLLMFDTRKHAQNNSNAHGPLYRSEPSTVGVSTACIQKSHSANDPRYVREPKNKEMVDKANVKLGRRLESEKDPPKTTGQTTTYLTVPGDIPYWYRLGERKQEIKQLFSAAKKRDVDGCYIVRNVTGQGSELALTVTYRKKLKHFLIHSYPCADGRKLYLFSEGYRAESVKALIDYYKDNPLCSPTSPGGAREYIDLFLKYPIFPGPNLETVDEKEESVDVREADRKFGAEW